MCLKSTLWLKALTTSIERKAKVKISYKHSDNLFVLDVYKSNQGTIYNEYNVQIKKQKFIREVLNFKMKPENPLRENNQQENVVIDFSSPNIAKPFHIGHLRSTIIGNFIANIYKYYQNKVVKLNYLGDWGTQFGLVQYGLDKKNIDINVLKKNPIELLYNLYVEMNELSRKDVSVMEKARKYFTDIELGESNLENWIKIREITISEFERMYNRLGIKFDVYQWESDYNRRKINNIIDILEKKRFLIDDNSGTKSVEINGKNIILLKSDNTTLYVTRDIAALVDRYNRYKFDRMIYVVDKGQTNHFNNVFNIAGRINQEYASTCEHVPFGKIIGMSTRKGNVVFLNDVLDTAKEKMIEMQKFDRDTRDSAKNENTWDILAKTAIVINDLKLNRLNDYKFEWNKALQSTGNSGIKLQYVHCRLYSLEKNSGVSIPDVCEPDCLTEEIVGNVIALLGEFDNIMYRSYIEKQSSILLNYLFKLSKCVGNMYRNCPVRGQGDVGSQRLLVFHRARIVLKTGLEILGVKPLDEM